jgi:hypothetical protein
MSLLILFGFGAPSEIKVIKTRDVTFNEELFYDLDSATLTEHLDLDSDVDIDDNDEAIPGDQTADQGRSTEPLDKNTDPTRDLHIY